MAEGSGGDGVEAACGFIEEKNARSVHKRAGQTQALNRAGRECTHLAIQSGGQFELGGQLSDAIAGGRGRNVIKAAKEEKIFAAGEARVETKVASSVIAEIAADVARGLRGIVAADAGLAARGKKQSRKNTKKSGLAGAIGAKERDGFAFVDFEGDILQSGNGGFFERLKKGAPAGTRGREELYQRFDRDCVIGHREVIARPRRRNNLRLLLPPVPIDCGPMDRKLQGDRMQSMALEWEQTVLIEVGPRPLALASPRK